MLSSQQVKLPIPIQNIPTTSTAILTSSSLMRSKVIRNLDFLIQQKLPHTIETTSIGEVEKIFLALTAQTFKNTASRATYQATMLKYAFQAARLSHSVLIYTSKSNVEDVRLMMEGSFNRDKTADDAVKGREDFVRALPNIENISSPDPTKAGETMLTYAGMGLLANLSEPIEVVQAADALVELWNEAEKESFLDLTRRFALMLYLSGVEGYKTIFTTGSAANQMAFFASKARALLDYAHMFVSISAIESIYQIAENMVVMDTLMSIAKKNLGWNAVADLEYANLMDKIDELRKSNPLFPLDMLTDVIKKTIVSASATGWVPVSGKKDSPFDSKMLASIESLLPDEVRVPPGEAAIFLPRYKESVLTQKFVDSVMRYQTSLIKETKLLTHTVKLNMSSIQLTEETTTRVRNMFSSANISEPDYFYPRYSSVLDITPSVIGIPKRTPEDRRTLSEHYGSVISYVNLYKKVQSPGFVGTQFTRRDSAVAREASSSLVTLPMPSHYLLGENYHPIRLTDDTVTLYVKGSSDSMPQLRYSLAVEMLMFRSDPLNFPYHAALLSGAYTVIIGGSSKLKDELVDASVTLLPVTEGASALIPGPATLPFGSTAPDVSNRTPYAYGMSSAVLVQSNVSAWLKQINSPKSGWSSKKLMDETIIWSSPSKEFGLLPHISLPIRSLTKTVYSYASGIRATAEFVAVKGEPKMTSDFYWTDVFCVLPHIGVEHKDIESIASWSPRLGFFDGKMIQYCADILSTPTIADISAPPRSWTNELSTAAPDDPTADALKHITSVVTSLENKLPTDAPASDLKSGKEPPLEESTKASSNFFSPSTPLGTGESLPVPANDQPVEIPSDKPSAVSSEDERDEKKRKLKQESSEQIS